MLGTSQGLVKDSKLNIRKIGRNISNKEEDSKGWISIEK